MKSSALLANPLPRWLGSSLIGIAVSGLLLGLYARGGWAWPLGFVALVPWLITLNRASTWWQTLLSGLLMSVVFVFAVFTWFADAISAYTGISKLLTLLMLGALAPLLQPQWLAFVLFRRLLTDQSAWFLRACVGALAWVGCEWMCPKLLGDSLGHALYPSEILRQWADLGGVAGISFVLLMGNDMLAHALSMRRRERRAWMDPCARVLCLLALMFGYGLWSLAALRPQLAEPAPSMRIGIVQSAIVDYEKRRQEVGAYAVVREVLDTHFGLSQAAIEQHGVDALLWSETVYPTTFAHPRSTDGEALDQEILGFVQATQRPLIFGTYDVDDGGEYNAAAILDPTDGLLGFYRKTNPFPLTEYVPNWLDGPRFRRWFPWTGGWRPGNGPRVFPLRSADGRSLNVLPLICLDGVRPQMAIDGARLGAQAIVSLSNDSWFSANPLGARLHLVVAAFRSIETRLPQVRATANGLSAIIDPLGNVMASTAMGDRAVLASDIPLRDPPSTLMVRWGDWVGPLGLIFLTCLSVLKLAGFWNARSSVVHAAPTALNVAKLESVSAAALTPFWRVLAASLRLIAGTGLLAAALQMLWGDGLQVNSLAQIKLYVWAILLPLGIAWLVHRWCATTLRVEDGVLLMQQWRQRIEIPIQNISGLQAWLIPLPEYGVNVYLASGRRWMQGLAIRDSLPVFQALVKAGAKLQWRDLASHRYAEFSSSRAAARQAWLDHAGIKFLLFPLLPAIIAFRLHQQIAFGSPFGEYYTYGIGAYLTGLLIWWASWSMGLMLFAAALRIVIECLCLLMFQFRRDGARPIRILLERVARIVFFVGVPIWLIQRIVVS